MPAESNLASSGGRAPSVFHSLLSHCCVHGLASARDTDGPGTSRAFDGRLLARPDAGTVGLVPEAKERLSFALCVWGRNEADSRGSAGESRVGLRRATGTPHGRARGLRVFPT